MKRLTAQWVRKAEADAALLGIVGSADPELRDVICFHCQQCVEKYLKALLQEAGISALKTHNLVQLLDLLLPGDKTLRRFRPSCKSLSRFAVDYRYPGLTATKRQAEAARRSAIQLRGEIRARLGLP